MLLVLLPAFVAALIAIGLMCSFISAKCYFLAVLIPLPVIWLGAMGLGFNTFLVGAGLFMAALAAAALQMRWRPFAALALAIVGVGIVLQYRDSRSAVAEAETLRAQFPPVSLEKRLAFHEEHPVAGGTEAAARYRAVTDRREFGSRAWMLKRLHSESYLDFVAANDFGASRMPRVRRQSLVLPAIARTPVANIDLCFDNRELWDRRKPEQKDLLTVHDSGLEEFLDRDRMGYVDSIDRVFGFEPHAMAKAPAPIAAGDETWHVARLELVSLLKHDTPVAYVSDHLPNLEELDDVPTRPLDEFERKHLPTLEAGDLAIEEEPTAIRMLGAVRAGETCLACHSVPLTTLLGAFTYELRPVLHDAEIAATTSPKP